MKAQLIKIVVPKRLPGKASASMGTKVFTEEGAEISGITKITLIAQVGEPWRAVIECHVAMQDMEGIDAEIVDEVPKAPLMRVRSDSFGGNCPRCHSSERRSLFGLGKVIGCINEECPRYFGNVGIEAEILSKPQPPPPPPDEDIWGILNFWNKQ